MPFSRRNTLTLLGWISGAILSDASVAAQNANQPPQAAPPPPPPAPNRGSSPAPTAAPAPTPTPTPIPVPAAANVTLSPVSSTIDELNAAADANIQYMHSMSTTSPQATISVQYSTPNPYVPKETSETELHIPTPEDDPLNFEDKDASAGMYPQLFD